MNQEIKYQEIGELSIGKYGFDFSFSRTITNMQKGKYNLYLKLIDNENKEQKPLSFKQAREIKEKIHRMEKDSLISKRELRLYMQDFMPCGHVVASLLTCSNPPAGCCECKKYYNDDGSEWIDSNPK